MMTHGGARKGAGRKPLFEEKRQMISMRISPKHKKWLVNQASIQGESIGRMIEVLIDSYEEHCNNL